MRALLSGVLVLSVAACSSPDVQTLSASEADAIRAVMADLDAAYTRRDIASIVPHFTSDVAHLPPGEPAVIGIAAVTARDSVFLADYEGEIRSVVQEVGGTGDYAYARYELTESWTPRAGGETTSVTGKGVALFERASDGSWKLSHFVWNHHGDP